MRRYATGAWKTELTLKTKNQTAQKLRPFSPFFSTKKARLLPGEYLHIPL